MLTPFLLTLANPLPNVTAKILTSERVSPKTRLLPGCSRKSEFELQDMKNKLVIFFGKGPAWTGPLPAPY
jgi:hypothetical protein